MSYYFGPVAVDDLTPEAIAKMRQLSTEAALQAFLLRGLNRYALSTRIRLAIERAYKQKYITKPVEELTDEEFLSIRNIGSKSLVEIRSVLPAPKKTSAAMETEATH